MSATDFYDAYSTQRRAVYAFFAIAIAVLIAGFWNFRVVDEFGADFVAGSTIGDTSALAGDFALRGSGFGLVFAAIAGLAATFTACNCVVFAMLPGLTCSIDGAARKVSPLGAFAAFVAGVLVVSGAYGVAIGLLGTEVVEDLNRVDARFAQAQIVFSAIGGFMLVWGIIEMGFADKLVRALPEGVREFFGSTRTKAAMLGVLVGLFAVGRPFLVFREFLIYAASADSPVYGAITMMVQGLGQIAVMALLFFVVLYFAKDKITAVANNAPWKFRLVSGVALIAGGTYFIYYWGLALAWDIGQWGFKLGWYD
ncbi:MAG: sulfite exporter TauE/SafE family protein [Gammaproteobacteria bacterium]|nr:sulfite exporter TauE/SafE family protein [Gammaproteobacteria bacterium]